MRGTGQRQARHREAHSQSRAHSTVVRVECRRAWLVTGWSFVLCACVGVLCLVRGCSRCRCRASRAFARACKRARANRPRQALAPTVLPSFRPPHQSRSAMVVARAVPVSPARPRVGGAMGRLAWVVFVARPLVVGGCRSSACRVQLAGAAGRSSSSVEWRLAPVGTDARALAQSPSVWETGGVHACVCPTLTRTHGTAREQPASASRKKVREGIGGEMIDFSFRVLLFLASFLPSWCWSSEPVASCRPVVSFAPPARPLTARRPRRRTFERQRQPDDDTQTAPLQNTARRRRRTNTHKETDGRRQR